MEMTSNTISNTTVLYYTHKSTRGGYGTSSISKEVLAKAKELLATEKTVEEM
jgi:hypothetical protein